MIEHRLIKITDPAVAETLGEHDQPPEEALAA